MASTKSAKFFCENCGAEVPQSAKICRHCGRFFSSVRCPQCGLTGTSDKFSKGCPSCGYAFGSVNKNISGKKNKEQKKASFFAKRKLKKQIVERHDAIYGKNRQNRGDESLPVWMYLFVILLTGGVFFFFIKLLG